MRKLLTVVASIALIAGVFAAQALGHGGNRGGNDGHKWGWGHHGKRAGQVWRADLKAPTAPTEPTAAVAHYNGATGETGPTGSENTMPRGKFYFAQNGRWYMWAFKLKNLTPSTAYNVGIYVAQNPTAAKKSKTAHHKKKRASATAGALVGETIAVTTDAEGKAWAADKGPRSVFGLDKKTAYVVQVKDASGANVLQGDLLRKTHRAHRGCDGYSKAGSQSRKHHHRH